MPRPVDAVLIAGSPSSTSRSSLVLRAIGAELESDGLGVRAFGVRDFPAEDLLLGRTESPPIVELLQAVERARVVVLATPVYKAVYAGALKTIVDLLRPEALAQKIVLGVATAKLDAHAQTVDRAFTELFAFFRGSIPLPTLVLLDPQLPVTDGELAFEPAAQAQFARTVAGIASALR